MKNMKLIMENWRKFSTLLEEEGGDVSQQIQNMIDKNDFLKGKLVAKQEDLIESSKFVLLLSEESARHVAERHLDGSKPGSLFNKEVDLREIAKKVLEMEPSDQSGGRVKWLGVEAGKVGSMGLKKASPEEIEKMQDYQMPDGRKETVKIAAGERSPTNQVTLITAELGSLSDGRKALSLITMFPGGMEVDGVQIPADRGAAAAAGLYFVVDAESPLLKSSEEKPVVTKESLRKMIKKILKEATDFERKQQEKDRIYDDLLERYADDYPGEVYGTLDPSRLSPELSVEEYKKMIAQEIPEYAKELDLQDTDDRDKYGSVTGDY